MGHRPRTKFVSKPANGVSYFHDANGNMTSGTRHCFIDYERESTIVAGLEVDGRRKLVGEGNLFSELDRSVAEFAMVVTDEWQNRGLGGLLLDYCIKIAGTMGVNRIVAETEPRNHKMH